MQKKTPIRRPVVLAALSLLLTAALSGPAEASVVLQVDLEQMVERADGAVHARALKPKSRWTADRKQIVTETTFEVQEALLGRVRTRRVSVTTFGGVVEGIRMMVSGSPGFKEGQEVVLFLEKRGKRTVVMGMNQGVFDVRRDKQGRSSVHQRRGGLALVRRTKSGLASATPRPREAARTLRQFKDQVRKIQRARCDADRGPCRRR